MPFFIWKGKNSYGESRKGVLEAPNIEEDLQLIKAIEVLREKIVSNI